MHSCLPVLPSLPIFSLLFSLLHPLRSLPLLSTIPSIPSLSPLSLHSAPLYLSLRHPVPTRTTTDASAVGPEAVVLH